MTNKKMHRIEENINSRKAKSKYKRLPLKIKKLDNSTNLEKK
jgi:hypothetical protein